MSKIIDLVQIKLIKLEESELAELTKDSQDEAIRIALLLALNPAPPIPDFTLDDTYKENEKLADLTDDVFGKVSNGEEYYEDHYKDKISISDTDALKQCVEWKEKYNVVIGVSWGDLPYDVQQKWLEYSCDYHLQKET